MPQYRVRVTGSSTKSTREWGGDAYIVDSPNKVTDLDDLLVIELPPFAGAPAMHGRGRRRPTGPSQVIYPRGGWDKVTITEIIPDPESDKKLEDKA